MNLKLSRIRTAIADGLRVVKTIESSTKARGDISNHDRAELARLSLEKALEECERVAAQTTNDEPRRTAIDPVTELAAARAWLEAIASSGTNRPAERNYARTIIAAVDVRGGPGVLGMRAAEWLRARADSRHPMHSRWARAVLSALETPRNRLAVVR